MDDELTHKYLEGEELTDDEILRGLRLGTLQYRIVPVLTGSALKNKGVQPMLDAVVEYLPSPLDVPPVIGDQPDDRRRAPAHASTTASRSARSPSRSSPTRSSASWPSSGSTPGTLKAGSYVLNATKGKQGADRAPPPDAREPARGDRGGLRGRHRRRRRPQGDLHRRHAGRPGPPDPPRDDDLPGAGHRGHDRAQDQGRPGQAGRSPCSASPRRTRPSGSRPTRRAADAHRRHGRAAPRRDRRPDDPRVQGRGQRRQAPGGLPRDDPPRRRGQRPLRPPDRRQGPVRPRRS